MWLFMMVVVFLFGYVLEGILKLVEHFLDRRN